jgi:TM2 domain-containing membrane protein YozV
MALVKCMECGKEISSNAQACPSCGYTTRPAAESKNKTVAGLLALFLGGIGIHKFYLGKGLQGLLYLVFCWTFIPAVIGFIEGLNYLLMSEETFLKRYS